MLIAAFVILVAVALGGDFLAFQVFRKKPIPAIVTQGHVAAAALGIVVLVAALAIGDPSTAGWIALAIFASGFTGGFILFGWIYAGSRPPLWAVGAHGALGWAGVAALFLAL